MLKLFFFWLFREEKEEKLSRKRNPQGFAARFYGFLIFQ